MSCLDGSSASGSRFHGESLYHINFLELYCVFLSVNYLLPNYSNSSIHILTDNTSAIYYINKRGGTYSPQRCALALELWELCLSHNVLPTASHVPGIEISLVDKYSRASHDNQDCCLNRMIFADLLISYNSIQQLICSPHELPAN